MSPRRLRNRKKIKAPTRLEDEYAYINNNTSPLRQESPEEVSEESSELEEEIYESPKPRTPQSRKRPAYSGKVTEFSSKLPPAAFPTLDHPSYVHNGGTVEIDLELYSLGSKSQDIAGLEAINPDSLGRHPRPEGAGLTEYVPIPTLTTADFTHRNSPFDMQRSEKGQKEAPGNVASGMQLGPGDSGPQNPIWASNMARMVEAGKMSDLDRIMLEMETSDEEGVATDRRSKVARKDSNPKYPAWDDLTVTHKLDLADTIAESYPDPEHIMHQLQLNPPQKEELVEMLIERQDRAAREKANQQTLMSKTKEMLLRGEPLPQSKFHQMVEETLYETIREDHQIQTNLMELKKARAYLGRCGFNPALADDNWDLHSISNVAEPRPAQAPLSSSEAGESSLSRPALATSFPKGPHLPDSHPELGQQQQPQALASQHRRSTAAHAQQSPFAPSSSVPIESHRAVPLPSTGRQSSEDLRSIRQKGTMRAAQQHKSASDLSAVQSNNALSSAGRNRPKVSAAASPQVPPNDRQLDKSPSVPGPSHTLAHKGGPPIAQANQHHQSSTGSNAGTSAPQSQIDITETRNLANKKRRKKGAN